MEIEKFVKVITKLLEKEKDAEIEENRILQENVSPKELQRRGVCLLKLRVGEQKTGLYGRTVLKLEPYWEGKELPSHNFTPGDIAGISLSSGDRQQDVLASGIVTRTSQSAVSVAFDESHDSLDIDDQTQYKLVKLANDVTYKRLKHALVNLNNYRSGISSQLINVLFGISEPSPPISQARDGHKVNTEITFFNSRLDASQQEAVRFALYQREVAIIHGPPGTGKTTTVVEIILQAVKQKLKVLVCAPSNIAVDNLVERLVANGNKKLVRLGHPARLLAAIQSYSLDALLAGSDETQLVQDVRRDMDKTLSKLKKARDHGERQRMREDLKFLRKELRQREQAATKGILKRAEVVLATLTGATDDGPMKMLEEEHFDLVVIDECSQALEAACWIALLKGPRCILAGDHNQLPPTILSHKAAKEGLEVTLMERLLNLHGDKIMRMLTVQYRMNEVIMKWSSDQLYQGKLTAHQSVANHLLCDIQEIENNEDTSIPMLLIDTADCDLTELNLPDEVSKANEGEADLVSYHVEKLIKSGLSADHIAVIAPYNLQVDLLRIRLSQKYPKLEIKSVDGFQGREKEAVIISLVRSNDKGEVGFLAEDRRMNVAITRARRHLAVVCDTETVSSHAFLGTLVEYMTEHGEVRSAQQYIQDGAIKAEYQRPEYMEQQLQTGVQQKKQSGTKKENKPTRQKQNKQKDVLSASDKNSQPKASESKPLKHQSTAEITVDSDEERNTLQNIIEDFVADKQSQVYAFPASLSSRERYFVHELAEAFGLIHISEGDGQDRHITIKKVQIKSKMPVGRDKQSDSGYNIKGDSSAIATDVDLGEDVKPKAPIVKRQQEISSSMKEQISTNNQTNPTITSDNNQVRKESDDTNVVCENCGKEMPNTNLSLHQLRCVKSEPQLQSGETGHGFEGHSAKPKKKNKKSKDKKNDGKAAKAEDIDDFDALIQSAIEQNTVCNFQKCKNYTTTVGQNCAFCAKRFCLSHHIPEVHGCGAQAKSHARAVINKEGVLYRGSGVPDKKTDPAKRAHLQRKLEQKVGHMAEKRKIKKKDKE